MMHDAWCIIQSCTMRCNRAILHPRRQLWHTTRDRECISVSVITLSKRIMSDNLERGEPRKERSYDLGFKSVAPHSSGGADAPPKRAELWPQIQVRRVSSLEEQMRHRGERSYGLGFESVAPHSSRGTDAHRETHRLSTSSSSSSHRSFFTIVAFGAFVTAFCLFFCCLFCVRSMSKNSRTIGFLAVAENIVVGGRRVDEVWLGYGMSDC
jgi:hypothetical protein